MLLSHVKRLCIISASLIAAAPHNAAPTVTSVPITLPTELQQDVPSCAHSCIQTSLSERFPVACTAQRDIECLCSRYSTKGESLGEVALGCVYASCGSIDTAASAYNVCFGQRNAVLPTKTALTVIPSSISSTAARFSTSPTTSTSRTTITSITRSILQTQVSSSQSVFVDSISLPATATSTTSTTPISIAAPAADDDRPKMSPAQIAGLSVAAVAAFIIAIGLMALSVFLRRRKERKSMYMNEKDEDRRRQQAARFSHYVPMADTPASSTTRFPIAPPPPASRDGPAPRYPRLVTPSPFSTVGISTLASGSGRTVVRPGVGTSVSAASVPMSQIGLAISAELEGCPAPPKKSDHPRQKVTEEHFRPVSTRTEATVFEEDDEIAAHRRSSKLLPTPPVPIMPIRSLQPSRLPLNAPSKAPSTSTTSSSRTVRRSELFLDIPVRHERPLPKRIMPTGLSATGSPAPKRPVPQLQTPSSSSQPTTSTSTSTITPTSAADIPDYYFSTNSPPERDTTPRQDSDTLPVAKTRKFRNPSSTTGSRTVSKTSTRPTFRDSVSSQTSFETADPDDPTPEDDSDDKQLSDDNKLSPVAESPIHALRYPKVPRASNQLVPRSPPMGSTRRSREEGKFYVRPLPSPSSLLVKRRGEREAVQLEQNLVLKDPFVTPTRRELRQHSNPHRRNVSANSWEHTPASKVERYSVGRSPLVVGSEKDVVRPLSIVKKANGKRVSGQEGEMIGLKSPVWIPHLTPARKGDDLFISVGWGDNLRSGRRG